MSAWIVSELHIDALVCGGVRYQIPFDGNAIDHTNAQTIGQALWQENYNSVNDSYDRTDAPPTYTPVGETNFPPADLFKLAACYDYQTCEHDAYEDSASRAFVHALQEATAAALNMTPDAVYDSPLWDKGPWGI